MNRRGYSQFVLCRDCGYVARCPNCAVSLAFHAAWNSLRCHHCDYGRPAPTVCPSCKGTKIRGSGIGTERVEEEVQKYFPDVRVARMDRDTTSRKGAHAGILRRFREGEADILIGTQMVAKGLDFPNVTLVGVISADTSINMPDFRAAERAPTPHTGGRTSGQGVRPGEVVIQTFSPEHYSLQMAQNQDYRGFYRKEIEFEKSFDTRHSADLRLICTDEQAAGSNRRAHSVAAALKSVVPKEVDLIGPAPAALTPENSLPMARCDSRARRCAAWDWIRAALAQLPLTDRIRTAVDVDPMSMA